MNLTTSRSDVLQQLIDQNAIIIQQNQELAKLNKGMLQYFSGQAISASPSMFLDNCTDVAFNAPEGVYPMAYKRTRVRIGINADGSPKYTQISGNTEDERNDNIVRAYVNSGRVHELFSSLEIQHGLSESTIPSEPEKGLTVGDIASEYLSRYFVGRNENYVYQVRKRLERMQNFIGKDTLINSITLINIQAFLDSRAERGLSKTTIADDKRAIKQFFQYAEDAKYIQPSMINFRRIKNNGVKKKTRKAATVAQYEDILNNICNIPDPIKRLCVAIPAYTGIRPEELLGLQWEDIDWNQKRIYIQRAVRYSYETDNWFEGDPKTEASKDWIPIADGLWEHLVNHCGESGWIIHDDTGAPFKTLYHWQKFWNSIHRDIDLHGLKLCEFRKTFASVLIARGVDPKTAQRWLRHSSAEITMNIYAEPDTDAFIASCDKLNIVK